MPDGTQPVHRAFPDRLSPLQALLHHEALGLLRPDRGCHGGVVRINVLMRGDVATLKDRYSERKAAGTPIDATTDL